MTIQQILEKIQNEKYGEDVRQAIINGIQLCYDEKTTGGYCPVDNLNSYYSGTALCTSAVSNSPFQSSFVIMSAGNSSQCFQVAISASDINNGYVRKKQNGYWSSWEKLGAFKKIRYWNYDGTELLYTEKVANGGNGGWNGSSTKESTPQYTYTFAGWSTQKDAASADANATKNITANRDVYAAFTATLRSYNVNFYNGTTFIKSVLVPYGSNASDGGIPTPTKASTAQYNYTFAGWNSSDGQSVPEANVLNNITGEKNVYAAYSATVRSYHVYFYNASTLLYTDTVLYGSDSTYVGSDPTKSSTAQYMYTFSGWNRNSSATSADANATKNITGDRNVYAMFTATVRTYRVRFMNGTTVLQTFDAVPYGSNATYTGETPRRPTDPDEYIFIGFDPDGTNIQADTDCQAVYILKPKELRYWNYDGTELLHTELVEVGGDGTWNGTSSKDSTTEHSYIFLGWNTSKNASVADANATKNLTADRDVYAAFEETVRSYSVHFYNGATLLYTDLVQYGDNASYTGSDPTKDSTPQYDYHFEGWNSQNGQTAAESGVLNNITDDKNVYAAFSSTLRQYTVTFMNGSVTLGTVTVNYGSDASDSTITTPTKASTPQYNYSFEGWNSQDGQSAAESGILNSIVSNKTVYAAFSSSTREYTVTFINVSTTVGTDTVPYGGTAEYSGSNPARSSTAQYDYEFAGWNSQNGQSTEEAGVLENITGDKTVYAAYRSIVRQYYVIFMKDANTTLGSVKVNYGSNASDSSIATPTKDPTPYYEYNFVGWNSQADQTEAEAGVLNNITAQKTVYAAFAEVDRRKYVYFRNGNTLLYTDVVPYGGTASYTGDNPTKESTAQYIYTFAGWNSRDGQSSAESNVLSNITANKTVYAAYSTTLQQYTVTFFDGETTLYTDTVEYGGTAVYDGSNPTKESTAQYDYAFAGWNSQSGQSEVESGVLENITGDKNVYAVYSETLRMYTVTFMNGTTTLGTANVAYGATATYSGSAPTKASTTFYEYTFAGWNSQDGQSTEESGILENITGDKTVYAAFNEAWNGILYYMGQYSDQFPNNGWTLVNSDNYTSVSNNSNGVTLNVSASASIKSRMKHYHSKASFDLTGYSKLSITYYINYITNSSTSGMGAGVTISLINTNSTTSILDVATYGASTVRTTTTTKTVDVSATTYQKAVRFDMTDYGYHDGLTLTIQKIRVQV